MARTAQLLAVFLTLITEIIALSLPAVTGKYNVGTVQFPLTDHSRNDSSAPAGTPRSIMVQLFYPSKKAADYPLAPYITPEMALYIDAALGAPNGTINQIKTNSHQGAPLLQTASSLQTVFFSHGLGTYRALYTTLVEDLASHGYLVVSIDHPYDASIVEFPDGTLIFLDPSVANATDAHLAALQDVRVKDVLFALSSLQTRLPALLPGASTHLRIRNPGTFGHSFGGAAAANVMLAAPCFAAGINMDGTIYGPASARGLDRPFLLMGVPDHNIAFDATWAAFWARLHGRWRRELVIAGAGHRSYEDVGIVAQLLLGAGDLPADAELGTIEPGRANALVRMYVRGFFDFVLRGMGDGVFAASAEFPEVSFRG